MRIRFRIDGVLQETARVPKRMVAGVVSRIKIMSELDIAEKRVPQDGRVGVMVDDRRIDLRVTTLPTQRGEGASIRILDEAAALRTLDDLGMDGDQRERFEDLVPASPTAPCSSPGPTGAGKSTTLYAALQDLNKVDKHIVTIEDPVEYRLAGRQPDRRPPQGRARPSPPGLRSVLRADPDVIMVGEIRDAETARIAIEAALTGHMVLTHAAHQRCAGRHHPPAGDGDRVLPHLLGDRLRGRPAARAGALRALQAAHGDPAGSADGGRLPGRRPTSRPTSRSAASAATASATGAGLGIYSVMVLSERIKEMVVEPRPRGRDRQGRPSRRGCSPCGSPGSKRCATGLTSVEEVSRVAS